MKNVFFILLIVFISQGCELEPSPAEIQVYTISIVNGDEQQGCLGEKLRSPIRVRVTDESGGPLSDLSLKFEILTGGGEAEDAMTNANGIAEGNWTLGEEDIEQQMRITIKDVAGLVSVTPLLVKGYANCIRDRRDNQTYQITKINDVIIMAENLNRTAKGICYDNSTSNCNTYGRLYTPEDALGEDSPLLEDKIPSGIRGICMPGWHLPSTEEYEIIFPDGHNTNDYVANCSLWNSCTTCSNSTGFSALPGGAAFQVGNDFNFITKNQNAMFLTASGFKKENGDIGTLQMLVPCEGKMTFGSGAPGAYSCRCIKD